MTDGPYEADGKVIRKKPVREPCDGGTRITIGFPVCTMTEYCDDQAKAVAALLNLGHAAQSAAQPIDADTPRDRRIFLWMPWWRQWLPGRWEDDQFNRKPRPFWRYEGICIVESREHPPTHWRDEPAPPDAAATSRPASTKEAP